ncbi:hypothetical protein HO133_007629 [Letharia lupina]|uniref:Uncharacterized protein n=1 Tax=Letharia lupina TaxID=560253 RepID=A0A8H6FH36_9LECA|nr:uncharacterized protein HO133_007629 [Letharia lupina]KAF6227901.1 hypothetical protein HO133_007629 [Letharia lupina]
MPDLKLVGVETRAPLATYTSRIAQLHQASVQRANWLPRKITKSLLSVAGGKAADSRCGCEARAAHSDTKGTPMHDSIANQAPRYDTYDGVHIESEAATKPNESNFTPTGNTVPSQTVETTHDEEEAIEISSTSTAAGSSITFTTNLEYFSGFFRHRITQYRQRECGSLLRSSDSALSNSPGTASDISTGSTDSILNRLFKQFDHVHGIVKQESRERLRQERDRFRQDRLNYLNGVPSHMGLPSNTGYAPPVNQLLELNPSDSASHHVGSARVSTAPAPEAASQVDSRPPWSVNSGGFDQTSSAPCGHPSNVSPQSLSNQFASMPPSFPPRTSDRSNAMAASGLSPRQEQLWT